MSATDLVIISGDKNDKFNGSQLNQSCMEAHKATAVQCEDVSKPDKNAKSSTTENSDAFDNVETTPQESSESNSHYLPSLSNVESPLRGKLNDNFTPKLPIEPKAETTENEGSLNTRKRHLNPTVFLNTGTNLLKKGAKTINRVVLPIWNTMSTHSNGANTKNNVGSQYKAVLSRRSNTAIRSGLSTQSVNDTPHRSLLIDRVWKTSESIFTALESGQIDNMSSICSIFPDAIFILATKVNINGIVKGVSNILVCCLFAIIATSVESNEKYAKVDKMDDMCNGVAGGNFGNLENELKKTWNYLLFVSSVFEKIKKINPTLIADAEHTFKELAYILFVTGQRRTDNVGDNHVISAYFSDLVRVQQISSIETIDYFSALADNLSAFTHSITEIFLKGVNMDKNMQAMNVINDNVWKLSLINTTQPDTGENWYDNEAVINLLTLCSNGWKFRISFEWLLRSITFRYPICYAQQANIDRSDSLIHLAVLIGNFEIIQLARQFAGLPESIHFVKYEYSVAKNISGIKASQHSGQIRSLLTDFNDVGIHDNLITMAFAKGNKILRYILLESLDFNISQSIPGEQPLLHILIQYFQRTEYGMPSTGAQYPYVNLIKLLCSRRSEINLRDPDGNTAVLFALQRLENAKDVNKNYLIQVIKALIKSEAHLGYENKDNKCALDLLKSSSNPKLQSFRKWYPQALTPLFEAIKFRDTEFVERMTSDNPKELTILRGTSRDPGGKTPLHFAMNELKFCDQSSCHDQMKVVEMISTIIDCKNKDVFDNTTLILTDTDGYTPIQFACNELSNSTHLPVKHYWEAVLAKLFFKIESSNRLDCDDIIRPFSKDNPMNLLDSVADNESLRKLLLQIPVWKQATDFKTEAANINECMFRFGVGMRSLAFLQHVTKRLQAQPEAFDAMIMAMKKGLYFAVNTCGATEIDGSMKDIITYLASIANLNKKQQREYSVSTSQPLEVKVHIALFEYLEDNVTELSLMNEDVKYNFFLIILAGFRPELLPKLEKPNAFSLLHLAVYLESTIMTEYLLEQSSNLRNLCNLEDGDTPLHIAARLPNVTVVKMLIFSPEPNELLADIHVMNKLGLNPLHLACRSGYQENVKLLLLAGADVNKVIGFNPVSHHAVGVKSVTKFYEDDKYSTFLYPRGCTSLHLAAEGGFVEIVKLLVDAGADPMRVDNETPTPLQSATLNDNNKIREPTVMLLLESTKSQLFDNESLITVIPYLRESIKKCIYKNIACYVTHEVNWKKAVSTLDEADLKKFSLTCNIVDWKVISAQSFAIWSTIVLNAASDMDKASVVINDYLNKFPRLVDAKDDVNRTIANLAIDPIKTLIQSTTLWHRRYKLLDIRPEHMSATCFVFKALDEGDIDPVTKEKLNTHVALKLMVNLKHFLCEINARKQGFDDRYVINIVRTHPEVIIDSDCGDWPQMIELGAEALATGVLSKQEAESMYCLVMPLADRNLFVAMKQERFAGCDVTSSTHIFRCLVNSVSHLHERGIVHADVKPMNVVRMHGEFKLIDLDAASTIGGGTVGRKCSSAYCPPEVIRQCKDTNAYEITNCLPADPSFDVWSLGCILYQLLHPQVMQLFQGDRDDNLTNDESVGDCLALLYEWPDELKRKKLSAITEKNAINLLSLMLNKDPKRRITLSRIMDHPFLSGKKPVRLLGDKATYDAMISYRVDYDEKYAELIYRALSNRGFKIFWDKECLQSGVDWEHSFCEGLVSSDAFIPILSRLAVNNPNRDRHNFSKLKTDSICDNVLLEHRLAVELHDFGLISKIFPVLIGDFDVTTGLFTDYLISGCHPNSPEVSVSSVEAKLIYHLEIQALGPPQHPNRTVKSVEDKIRSFQGSLIKGLEVEVFNDTIEIIATMIDDLRKKREKSEVVGDGGERLSARIQYNEKVSKLEEELLHTKTELANTMDDLKVHKEKLENLNRLYNTKLKHDIAHTRTTRSHSVGVLAYFLQGGDRTESATCPNSIRLCIEDDAGPGTI